MEQTIEIRGRVGQWENKDAFVEYLCGKFPEALLITQSGLDSDFEYSMYVVLTLSRSK